MLRWPNILVIGISEGEEIKKEIQATFEVIMTEKFPKMTKDIKLQL